LSIVGVGIDVVGTERMEALLSAHGDRFLARCFRSFDSSGTEAQSADPVEIAGLWAAKEAFLKALGADVSGIPYRDIEIIREGSDAGTIRVHGKAREILARAGARSIHLSMDQDGGLSVATVILEN